MLTKYIINDGKNGIDSINKMNFDICKFKRYINEFDFIFTTNYDHILDDAFIKEVCHLHGGYNYKEEGDSPQKIIKVNNVLSYRDAYLIWGINEEEKRNGIRNTKFTRYEMDDKLNVSFDLEIADSVLKGYFDQLKNGEYAEIHIWGYSGLNDGHINKAIDENVNLKKVYYYVAPGDVDSRKIFEKKNSLYNSKQNHIIKLRSWDDIWNEFIN